MPSRRSALSSATTIRSGRAGVASRVAMTNLQRTQKRFADTRDLQSLEHAVARILAETERPVEVYEAGLGAVGGSLGWELGAVWEAGADDAALRCVSTWHAGEGAPEFEALSERITLASGVGLPGQVHASAEPIWMVDAPADANFPRADAARRSGLHAAFGFPLRSPRGVVGVMEFFSREPREPDEQLLQTVRVLGSQVGQFVTRRRAEEEVRSSESRLRAMLEAALDAVVTMDQRGRVIGWNHAAEATFGYTAEEAPRPPPSGARALRRDRSRQDSRPAARARRHAQGRHGVPGRADDHANRRPRSGDVHRLPARHHGPPPGGAGAPGVACAAGGGR